MSHFPQSYTVLRRLGLAGAVTLVAASVQWSCARGIACPHSFDVLNTFTADKLIPCCETTAVMDVPISSGIGGDLEVDMAVHLDPSLVPRVDAWLTRSSCAQLFDPGSAAPKCEVLLGPVAAGTVSGRLKVAVGTYRVFVRPRDAGDAAVDALVDVRRWGNRCITGPGF